MKKSKTKVKPVLGDIYFDSKEKFFYVYNQSRTTGEFEWFKIIDDERVHLRNLRKEKLSRIYDISGKTN